MTPVFQTIINSCTGDCLRAAMASILDMRIEDVPNFAEEEGHKSTEASELTPCQRWLESIGLQELEFFLHDVSRNTYDHFCSIACMLANSGPVYALASLPSQSFSDCSHAVVIKINGYKKEPWVEVAHDPNPFSSPYNLREVQFRSVSFIVKHLPEK